MNAELQPGEAIRLGGGQDGEGRKTCPNCHAVTEDWAQVCPTCEYDWTGDTQRPLASFSTILDRHTPLAWATPTLIGLNCAVFAIMALSGVSLFSPKIVDLLRWGADYGPKVSAGQWWRLLTSTFIHIGIVHIAMNMVVLWGIGRFVERLLGSIGFLAVYLVLGLAGSVASVWWNPSIVAAGASGAIFGLYGLLLGFLLRNRRSIPGEELQKLLKGALIFLGYNLLFGATAKGVDMAAHIGGLVSGVAVGFACAQPMTEDGFRKRTRAALVTAFASLFLVIAAAACLPKSADLMAEYSRFDEVESKDLKIYNSTVERARRREINDLEFAQILESQVLPEWDGLRTHLLQLKGVPQARADFHTRLCAYMETREESWALLDAALKSQDLSTVKRSREKQSEADQLYQALVGKK